MDPEQRPDEEGPLHPWLPPDDRLWRHPSELASSATQSGRGRDDDPNSGATAPPGSAPNGGSETGDRRRERPDHRARSEHRSRSGGPAGSQSGPTRSLTVAATESREGRDLDRRLWTVAVLAGVVGALVATSTVVVVGQIDHPATVVRPIEQVVAPASTIVTLATDPRGGISAIAAHLQPAMVELEVNSNGNVLTGSGVVFSNDGYILTDDHVVQNAQSMVAVMSNGKKLDARLVGGDQETDIAVVQLRGGKPIQVATLGNSAQLQVGQPVIALGAPNGNVAVTSGIVSALNSQVTPTQGAPLRDMIQTDAPIGPGCNGGALVDAQGMVVAITTSANSGEPGAQTLSFATPIEVASDVANQLLQTGRVVHAWLGIEGNAVDVATAQSLGISGGAVVDSVDAGSPAARAGIVASDVITSLAGASVQSMSDLDTAVRAHRPGDRIDITYLRNGSPRSAALVLLQQPTD